MPKIAIVGAGHAGLQLGIGLLADGHDVTLVSAAHPSGAAHGRVMSSQCMFGPALAHERDLGLNVWDGEAPEIVGSHVTVADPALPLSWHGRVQSPAQSVDQRVKLPRWAAIFEERGGHLVVCEAGIDELEELAATHDLVVVSAGKGDIGQLFPRDASRSPHARPMRGLSIVYVHGRRADGPPEVVFGIVPGLGEYTVVPVLTLTGPASSLAFEALPDGPMDIFRDAPAPDEHLRRVREFLAEHLPDEADRLRHAEPTDERATLQGRFPPTVRKPVGELPSGRLVLGCGDTVVLNDPLTGQGSNNASHCAASYRASITAHGDAAFDRAFMEQTFDRFWQYAGPVTVWSNAMLEPPPEHWLGVYAAAARSQQVADRFARGFEDPHSLSAWFMDPAATRSYLNELEVAA
jgi:hypothetical protein